MGRLKASLVVMKLHHESRGEGHINVVVFERFEPSYGIDQMSVVL